MKPRRAKTEGFGFALECVCLYVCARACAYSAPVGPAIVSSCATQTFLGTHDAQVPLPPSAMYVQRYIFLPTKKILRGVGRLGRRETTRAVTK